jgi:hypothetical protein
MITMKGRHKVRANPPRGREPRLIEPWVLEPKENTALHKLEKAYLDCSMLLTRLRRTRRRLRSQAP